MIIIKIGGGKQICIDAIAKDIAKIVKHEHVILLHGASETRDEIAEKLGMPTKTITSPSGVSSVYTDESAIDVFLMTYCGLVNKKIVAILQANGVNAIGLSGVDGRLWEAKRKTIAYAIENGRERIIRDNLTGRVERVNTSLLKLLCENGYIPVICPPAISFENEIVNTDNDWAAAIMAQGLHAEKIVYLFEAPGMLRDADDETSVIGHIHASELDGYMPAARGRMKKKLLGAKKALENSTRIVYFGDGRMDQPITNALQGKGTVITA